MNWSIIHFCNCRGRINERACSKACESTYMYARVSINDKAICTMYVT